MANDVLLTGGTGVVGAALVPELAAKKQDVVIHLLVRARDESDLARRADELHGYWRSCGQPIDPGRTRFYRGDVTQPRLGLDDRDYAALSACVTHVIHSAGNVRLNESLADARRSAVDSARHIVEFARRGLQQGVLGKVDALSTIGVAGRLRGIVPERRLTERRSFRNTYEAAKAEAEELLWREIDAGMPLTIHRPSMVVGDSRTGRAIRPQVFRYLADFLSGRRTGGFLRPSAGRLGVCARDGGPRVAPVQRPGAGTAAGGAFAGSPAAVPVDERAVAAGPPAAAKRVWGAGAGTEPGGAPGSAPIASHGAVLPGLPQFAAIVRLQRNAPPAGGHGGRAAAAAVLPRPHPLGAVSRYPSRTLAVLAAAAARQANLMVRHLHPQWGPNTLAEHQRGVFRHGI
ncbi:MAG: hypothetical protein DCC67_15800 [Planctomycetota bacterium]|nr:MAG: hypothetical protein DCC67_15800 [Planctomycetota bacterium]